MIEVDYDVELEKSAGHPELVAWAHGLRERVKSAGIRRIVSTRWIFDASDLIQDGVYDVAEAKRVLLAPWSDQDIRQVGETR